MFYPIKECLAVFRHNRDYVIVRLSGFKIDILGKNTPYWVGTTIAIIPYQEFVDNGIIIPNSTDKVVYDGTYVDAIFSTETVYAYTAMCRYLSEPNKFAGSFSRDRFSSPMRNLFSEEENDIGDKIDFCRISAYS